MFNPPCRPLWNWQRKHQIQVIAPTAVIDQWRKLTTCSYNTLRWKSQRIPKGKWAENLCHLSQRIAMLGTKHTYVWCSAVPPYEFLWGQRHRGRPGGGRAHPSAALRQGRRDLCTRPMPMALASATYQTIQKRMRDQQNDVLDKKKLAPAILLISSQTHQQERRSFTGLPPWHREDRDAARSAACEQPGSRP